MNNSELRAVLKDIIKETILEAMTSTNDSSPTSTGAYVGAELEAYLWIPVSLFSRKLPPAEYDALKNAVDADSIQVKCGINGLESSVDWDEYVDDSGIPYRRGTNMPYLESWDDAIIILEDVIINAFKPSPILRAGEVVLFQDIDETESDVGKVENADLINRAFDDKVRQDSELAPENDCET